MRYDEIASLMKVQASRHGGACAAVAAPYSRSVLSSLADAQDNGFLSSICLVGDPDLIPFKDAAERSRFTLETASGDHAIGERVTALAGNPGTIVVKGKIASAALLAAVLAAGKPKRRLSHIYVIESRSFPDRALIFSDAGVNIRPDLTTKIDIVESAIELARKVGILPPRVALLSAVEMVNPGMPSTIDAAAIKVMGDRGRFGSAFIDGPLALDAALLPDAAGAKSLGGDVAGRADVLITADIESGNCTAKALIGASGRAMGIIYGASAPIAFPSRGDSEATRLDSLMLAAALVDRVNLAERAA